MLEIDNLHDFDEWASHPRPTPAAIQALDLTERSSLLCNLQCAGSLFLGCRMSERAAGHLVMYGNVVVPDLNGKAFTVHRSQLYSPEDLYAGFDPDRPETFASAPDQLIYREYLADSPLRPDLATGFARAAHDHSITDALDDLLQDKRVVAIMGGHKLERSSARYRQVVELAKALAERGYMLASGGGPGAMEATHLGAWLAHRDAADVDAVLTGPFVKRPEGAPRYKEYADPDWLARAWRVRQAFPRVNDVISVGIPTWLYGHEPPTPFATHLAKYFANSVREDGVLAIANHGVIFARGSAGTTQEIFQDACQNHYGTTGVRSPMVLLDRDYWTEKRPVWPLLDEVSRNEIYGELVSLVDTTEEALRAIQAFQPSWYVVSQDPHTQLEADLRRTMQLRENWSFSRVVHDGPPGAQVGWQGLLDWLLEIGTDNWIDVERGRTLLPVLCETLRIHRHPSGLVIVADDHPMLWTTRLDD